MKKEFTVHLIDLDIVWNLLHKCIINMNISTNSRKRRTQRDTQSILKQFLYITFKWLPFHFAIQSISKAKRDGLERTLEWATDRNEQLVTKFIPFEYIYICIKNAITPFSLFSFDSKLPVMKWFLFSQIRPNHDFILKFAFVHSQFYQCFKFVVFPKKFRNKWDKIEMKTFTCYRHQAASHALFHFNLILQLCSITLLPKWCSCERSEKMGEW